MELCLGYTESRSGGGICKGEEGNSWPSHEDEVIEWHLSGCFGDASTAPWLRERVTVDFEPVVGRTVWVVYVRYSTGGTFGRTLGACTIIGAYSSEMRAREVERAIVTGAYDGYKPWVGYFESFESCNVEPLTVQ